MGIKIIKLNAWEKVFAEKIQRSREDELKCLNKDSIYWTIMSKQSINILQHIKFFDYRLPFQITNH